MTDRTQTRTSPAAPSVRPTPATRAVERQPRDAYESLSAVLQRTLSVLALLALGLVFVLIALLIKMSGPGPVVYRGERVGRGFRRFTIYKFRTMLAGTAAKIGPRLLSPDEKYRYCTRIGRVLRRTKLDDCRSWSTWSGATCDWSGPGRCGPCSPRRS